MLVRFWCCSFVPMLSGELWCGGSVRADKATAIARRISFAATIATAAAATCRLSLAAMGLEVLPPPRPSLPPRPPMSCGARAARARPSRGDPIPSYASHSVCGLGCVAYRLWLQHNTLTKQHRQTRICNVAGAPMAVCLQYEHKGGNLFHHFSILVWHVFPF